MNSTARLNQKVRHLRPVEKKPDWDQVLKDWLATKRSPHTQRQYRLDINGFLQATEMSLGQFLNGKRQEAFHQVQKYRGEMLKDKLTSATINRRLSAIKSLVRFTYQCGVCEFTLDEVKAEKMNPYRDTTGVSLEQFKTMLNQCELTTEKGLRDYALLLIFWGNALRRSEISQLKLRHFDPHKGTLEIYGKGKGNESEIVTLGQTAVKALNDYLETRDGLHPDAPLFTSTNPGYRGKHLSGHGIYKIVSAIAIEAGIAKTLSPHRLRHSSITEALNATGGDVRAVQKLSRHANLNTLMIYDDNRRNEQGRVTKMLDDLI